MEKNKIIKNVLKEAFVLFAAALLTLPLNSCTDAFSKEEAYCFSAVFDKTNDNYNLTVFCKVHSSNSTEKKGTEILSLDFTAKSPIEAIKKSEKHNYEIYYKSCLALFFSDSLSDSEIYDILLPILNDTKYQSYVYIFNEKLSIDISKTEAEKIAENEKIDHTSKEKFLTLTEYIKDKQF